VGPVRQDQPPYSPPRTAGRPEQSWQHSYLQQQQQLYEQQLFEQQQMYNLQQQDMSSGDGSRL
jgi:hypothetical protein